jgi:hypothetical protein
MAVIPPDAGIRMRTQTDVGQLQALAPVRGVSADLPEFQVGQAFSARIQELLPDSTYKALVAGKLLTLQLPEGASPGDTLELTVVDRSGKTLIARRAENQSTAAGGAAQPYPYTKISTAGRMIGQLLLPEGESPRPAALTRGQPVLTQAPTAAADLAPALEKAVSESGLFYEAHQAQWVAGRRPLASLRAEPQGQLPVAPRQTSPNAGALADVTQAQESLSARANEQTPGTSPGSTQQLATAATTSTQSGQNPSSVPDGIRPLVQQQLDAVSTQRLAWHGEVWPGQSMDWEIERDQVGDRETAPEASEAPRWSTSLRLTMPQLGTVNATVQLSGNRLRLSLVTAGDETASTLRQQAPDLTQMMANAGLTIQSLDVRHETE